MPEPTFVILGGGPAGCAAAIALRQSGGGTVVVAESGAYRSDRIGESVPPDIRRLFSRLGLLDAFELEGHEPCYGSCSSWGDYVLGYNDFTVNPNGTGLHLDRRRFDAFLARRASKAGAHLVTGARFRSVRPHTGEPAFVVELETSAGVRQLKASFVVDATGSRARLARNLGARRLVHDRFFCATGYFHLRDKAELTQLTMLEAVPDGWWYAARLPDRRIAVAFACDGDDLRSATLHESTSWLRRLGQTAFLAPALSESFYIPGSLRVCPVPCFVLDRPAGPHWLAAGDAASSFDPLSGQGIHKALSNGLAAADTIRACLDGDGTATERYADGIRQSFDTFLAQRYAFYAQERRWPEATFWERRREPRR
ncbi:FAD-dependent oxidoreductase [Lentzea nigeriaca]|uniref:FAD-dependent oxidoreductase n=1 Tax=Lentzea nigeriaca TaxID=1128665 RepID=UPI00195D525E|nr:FAD-dependent oxidoreductase [Lentzea nigeriaca]MBM7863712.1 flavin-dependent dehydrogenase [Lentzea nigeriaca]